MPTVPSCDLHRQFSVCLSCTVLVRSVAANCMFCSAPATIPCLLLVAERFCGPGTHHRHHEQLWGAPGHPGTPLARGDGASAVHPPAVHFRRPGMLWQGGAAAHCVITTPCVTSSSSCSSTMDQDDAVVDLCSPRSGPASKRRRLAPFAPPSLPQYVDLTEGRPEGGAGGSGACCARPRPLEVSHGHSPPPRSLPRRYGSCGAGWSGWRTAEQRRRSSGPVQGRGCCGSSRQRAQP